MGNTYQAFLRLHGVFPVACVPLMLLALPTLFVMHKIAEEDDQKFRQLFLTFRVNFLGGKNKSHWGGVTSLAPCEYQDKLKTKLYKKQ
mgnify:CR=1 FL=1